MNKKRAIKESPLKAFSTKTLLFYAFILAAITFTVFSSTFHNQLTNWDDDVYITDNEAIRALDWPHLKQMFTSIYTKTYAPLSVLSFAVEYHFFKLMSFHYILDNVLLHIAVCILILLFGLQLGLSLRATFLSALLFAVHPLHVESVAWITERKDLLYSLFYMGTLMAYWRFLQSDRKALIFFWLSLFFGLLSILAKSMALSLPFILLVMDWFYGRKLEFKVFLEKVPFALYIVPVAFVTYIQHARVPVQDLVQGAIIWMWSFSFYIVKFIWPQTLCPVYEIPKPFDFRHTSYNISLLVVWVCTYLLFRFWRNRWVIFAFLYYYFSIFFLLRMDKETHQSVVADRFMYLPSLGFCFLVGWFLDSRLKHYSEKSKLKLNVLIVLLALLFATYSIKSYYQCKIWRDGLSLWQEVIRQYPGKSIAHNNLGVIYRERGELELALKSFSKAIEIAPDYGSAHYNRGQTYKDLGKYDLAIIEFEAAIKADPQKSNAYFNLSFLYLEKKDFKKSLEYVNKAIELKPNAGMYNNRSKAYEGLKDYPKALADALKAQELGQRYKKAHIKFLQEKVEEQKTQKQQAPPAASP